jgi:hypothetical protein
MKKLLMVALAFCALSVQADHMNYACNEVIGDDYLGMRLSQSQYNSIYQYTIGQRSGTKLLIRNQVRGGSYIELDGQQMSVEYESFFAGNDQLIEMETYPRHGHDFVVGTCSSQYGFGVVTYKKQDGSQHSINCVCRVEGSYLK